MDSTNAQQPDHAGPQSIEMINGLEVVPEGLQWAPADRRSSLRSPESYQSPSSFDQTERQEHECSGSSGESTRGHAHHEQPAIGKSVAEENEHSASSTKQNSTCGLPRKMFLWTIAALMAVVIVAAVLGGVLGPKLHKYKS